MPQEAIRLKGMILQHVMYIRKVQRLQQRHQVRSTQNHLQAQYDCPKAAGFGSFGQTIAFCAV